MTGKRDVKHATFFLNLAKEAARNGTCLRLQVGSVLVKEDRVISVGYNGAVGGLQTCLEVGCDVVRVDGNPHCRRAVHADQNALASLAASGGGARGATLYTTHAPCFDCLRLLAAAGVVKVCYLHDYDDARATRFYQEAGLERVRLSL